MGRGSDNDFLLTGRGVSRHHALFDLDSGILTVRDLDSTYGTRVNGSVIRKKRVGMGDSIDIGVFRVVVLPIEAVKTGNHGSRQPPGSVKSDDQDSFEMAETGEFGIGPQSRVHVVMGNAQILDKGMPADWMSTDETTIIHGMNTPADEGSDEVPVDVHIVDGWGSDAIARVLTTGAEGLIGETEGKALKKTEMYRRALGVLRSLADLSASGESRRKILRQGLEKISRVLESRTAVVLEVNQAGSYDVLAIRHSDFLEKGELPLSRSVVARAVREKAPVFSENLVSDPAFQAKDSVNMYRVGAVLALPVMQEERVVGVLYFARKAGETFTDFEVNVAHVMSSIVSGIMLSARLKKEILAEKQRRSRFDNLISPLVRERVAADPANPVVLETREITVIVARFLDLPEIIETMEPDRLLSIFADFHNMLIEVVNRNGGVLINTVEDFATIAFGLYNPARTDAQWAMNAAFELASYYDNVLKRRSSLKKGICVALASDNVLWGVVGCPRHLEHILMGGAKKKAMDLCKTSNSHGVVADDATVNKVPSSRFMSTQVSLPNAPPAFRISLNRGG